MGRKVLRAVAAVGAVVLVQVVGAAPAVADATTIDSRSIEFTFGGEDASCHLQGRTSYVYNAQQDLSLLQVEAVVSGADPCALALQEVRAAATYRREDDDVTTISTSGEGPEVDAEAAFRGPAVEVFSNFAAFFSCDEEPSFGCRVTFSTRTK